MAAIVSGLDNGGVCGGELTGERGLTDWFNGAENSVRSASGLDVGVDRVFSNNRREAFLDSSERSEVGMSTAGWGWGGEETDNELGCPTLVGRFLGFGGYFFNGEPAAGSLLGVGDWED